jgi:hypothetical protein
MEPEPLDTVTTSEAARLLSISERTLRRRLARARLKPIITGRAPAEENRYDRAAILELAPSGELQLQQASPADLAALIRPVGEQTMEIATLQSAIMSVMADLSGRSAEMAGLVRQMADNQMNTAASLSDIALRLARIEQRLDELTAPPPDEAVAAEIAPPPRRQRQF